MPMFQCGICHTKILENHLAKHHAKVHANVGHDIYTPLETNDAPQTAPKIEPVIDTVWSEHITTSADENMVHISCTICGNRMPIRSLDQHMKRKHNDIGDQVDAVGTKLSSTSFDMIEMDGNSKVAATTTVAVDTLNYQKKQFEEQAASWMTTGWPAAKNPFRFTAIPKNDASTMMDEDSQAFYTIRVSAAQMKQLMMEDRIDPKNGYFYLK